MYPRNKIRASGKIKRLGKDKYGHGTFTLAVNGQKPTEMIFCVSNNSPDLRMGDHVNVTGHVVSYSYYAGGKRTYVQYFVADSVSLAKTEREIYFGTKGGTWYGEQNCTCYFCGTVVYKSKDRTGSWGKLLIALDKENDKEREASIWVTYDMTPSSRLIDFDRIKKNDHVCLVAKIFSVTKKIGKDTVRFDNIITEDIAFFGESAEKNNKKITEKKNLIVTKHKRKRHSSAQAEQAVSEPNMEQAAADFEQDLLNKENTQAAAEQAAEDRPSTADAAVRKEMPTAEENGTTDEGEREAASEAAEKEPDVPKADEAAGKNPPKRFGSLFGRFSNREGGTQA